MGFKTIDYVANFELLDVHTISVKRLAAGLFTDTLEVKIDGNQVLLTQVRPSDQWGQTHSRVLNVDGQPIELIWVWSPITGNPRCVVLKTNKRLLAAYGRKKAIRKFGLTNDDRAEPPNTFEAVRLIRETADTEMTEEVGCDDFPLNNIAGSDTLTVEHEVSKTLESTLSASAKGQIEGRIKGSLLSVVESQIAGHLSETTGQTIGERTSRTQRINFSVKAGESVLYRIIWRVKSRVGECFFELDGTSVSFAYKARYGLSFEVSSHPLSMSE